MGIFDRIRANLPSPFVTSSGGGGGGTPGGSSGQVQYNGAGSFAGSANFFWDNTNSRVGVGTNSPSYPVDVKPTTDIVAMRIQAGGSGNGAALDMDASLNGGGGRDYRVFSTGSTNGDIGGGKWAVRDVAVAGIPSYRLVIDSSGNVKFGAYGAGYLQTDASGNITAGSVTVTAAGSTGAIQFNNSNALAADSSNLFWDDTNNRLGIKTASPLWELDVNGTTVARGSNIVINSTQGFQWWSDNTPTAAFTVAPAGFASSGGVSGSMNFMIFDGTWHTYATLESTTGRLGLGTVSPSAQLHTTGTVRHANFGAGASVFDSSGNISSVAPSTSGNVLTSNGTTWVSSAPTAASAATGAKVVATEISMPVDNWTQVTFASTTYDDASYVSGNTFVAPATGFYAIDYYCYIITTTSTDWLNIGYSINDTSVQGILTGSVGGSSSGGGGSGTNIQLGGTRIYKLTSGDVFRFFGQASATYTLKGPSLTITRL